MEEPGVFFLHDNWEPGGVVRVIGPEQRDIRTPDPRLQCFGAVSSRLTGRHRMCTGYALLIPGGNGVHHHGESETAIADRS